MVLERTSTGNRELWSGAYYDGIVESNGDFRFDTAVTFATGAAPVCRPQIQLFQGVWQAWH